LTRGNLAAILPRLLASCVTHVSGPQSIAWLSLVATLPRGRG